MNAPEVEDKFVIEVEKVFQFQNSSKWYAKIKGFNALFFDDNGLEKLQKIDTDAISEDAFLDGYKAGREDGWTLAQRISETTASDLLTMGMKMDKDFDDMSEYGVSCNVITSNSVDEVADKLKKFDNAHQDELAKNHHIDNIMSYIEDDLKKIAAPVGSKAHDRRVAELVVNAINELRVDK